MPLRHEIYYLLKARATRECLCCNHGIETRRKGFISIVRVLTLCIFMVCQMQSVNNCCDVSPQHVEWGRQGQVFFGSFQGVKLTHIVITQNVVFHGFFEILS